MNRNRAYQVFLDSAAADENVVGVVLSGSQVAASFVTDKSDFDVFVVLREPGDRWPFVRGSAVEVVAMTLGEFEGYALPGSAAAWNQPAFLNARVELDRLGGGIGRIVDRKRSLTSEEAAAIGEESLGAYTNSLYRSLRNLEAGRRFAGRLDAAESVSPLLTAVFALEGRVRPFNKWLLHELDRLPLAIPALADRAERIAREGDPGEQRAMFREVERQARAAGHGAVVDGWAPDVAWLRGDG